MIRFTRIAAAAVAAVVLAGVPAIAAAPALKAADYAKLLADPTRPEADRKDDAARKPAEVLEFAQIRPGETVLEIEVGRGWMTELISRAVGPKGSYPADGSDENNTYAKFTPSGELKLSVTNPALIGKFAEGEEYYLDFTKAPAAGA